MALVYRLKIVDERINSIVYSFRKREDEQAGNKFRPVARNSLHAPRSRPIDDESEEEEEEEEEEEVVVDVTVSSSSPPPSQPG